MATQKQVQAPIIEMQWIDIGEGFQGLLAVPPSPNPDQRHGAGILLIQEIFGVNAHIRALAEQYALDGFVVFAPDLFHRQKPHIELDYGDEDMQKGRALKEQIGLPTMADDLQKALTVLRARPELDGPVASIGYCMGGALSYLLAARDAVDGAVCYYGGGIQNMLDEAVKIRCPMLLHYGQNDPFIPIEAVESVSRALQDHGALLHVYPNVGHGFNCWARASYDRRATLQARARTLEFLAGL